jgi:hypothetical protein
VKEIAALAAALLAGSMGAAACGFQQSRNVLSPSSPSASTPTPSTSSSQYAGVWASQSITVPSPSSCSNFRWNVTNQTTTSMAGTFSATCAGGIYVTGEASGQLVNATTVPITVHGTASLSNVNICDFSLSGTGTIIDNGTALTIPYNGTACGIPVHGTETLRKNAPAASAPTPTPSPSPAPAPVPAGPADAIDLRNSGVYNSPADIASWPVTSTITSLHMEPEGSPIAGVSLTFTTQDSWPDYTPSGWNGPLQYTVWAVVNVNGQWDTSGFIQMWRGRPSTGAPILAEFPRNWAYDSRWGPMNGYQPHAGEQMGFFVSAGDARGQSGVTSVRERSNVVMVALPAGDSGNFTFSFSALPLMKRR